MLGAHLPPGWLFPVAVIFGIVVVVALLVLLLVSGADFDDSQTPATTTTPGTCAPFCTATPHAPAH
ncbi:hypothetical protein [Nocardia mexicana]|uniref:Uncharacterized protein n=1 Tax=Nocardia mexicana TaxID=279262 RepID=A0A370H8M4_9NOCA|nr:hypothetical protein [Nocardia mexicana]RDI53032.1 hypothetical protein DFR68_103420 [Nocardia mexicana]